MSLLQTASGYWARGRKRKAIAIALTHTDRELAGFLDSIGVDSDQRVIDALRAAARPGSRTREAATWDPQTGETVTVQPSIECEKIPSPSALDALAAAANPPERPQTAKRIQGSAPVTRLSVDGEVVGTEPVSPPGAFRRTPSIRISDRS